MSRAADTPQLQAEFLLQVSAELTDPQVLADGPLGTRRIVYMRRGAFSGPRLRGELLPGGGDWVLLRRDGAAELDIRATLQADDGALLYMSCRGLLDIASAVRERILKGEAVDPAEYYFRTAAFFETGAKSYLWLNRLVAVGVARRTATGMITDVFAIR